MRISDWSSDVCSSDLTITSLHSDGSSNTKRINTCSMPILTAMTSIRQASHIDSVVRRRSKSRKAVFTFFLVGKGVGIEDAETEAPHVYGALCCYVFTLRRGFGPDCLCRTAC